MRLYEFTEELIKRIEKYDVYISEKEGFKISFYHQGDFVEGYILRDKQIISILINKLKQIGKLK